MINENEAFFEVDILIDEDGFFCSQFNTLHNMQKISLYLLYKNTTIANFFILKNGEVEKMSSLVLGSEIYSIRLSGERLLMDVDNFGTLSISKDLQADLLNPERG